MRLRRIGALVAIGLAGLGVPYVLSIGLWIVAVLSAITFGQRVYAVRKATMAGGQVPGSQVPGSQEPDGAAPEGPAVSDSAVWNNTGAKQV